MAPEMNQIQPDILFVAAGCLKSINRNECHQTTKTLHYQKTAYEVITGFYDCVSLISSFNHFVWQCSK
jgi:hypothetical protein